MTYDTWTPEGMKKELNKPIDGYMEGGNTAALVRLVGGSAADFDERYDPSMSGSHPDEIRSWQHNVWQTQSLR